MRALNQTSPHLPVLAALVIVAAMLCVGLTACATAPAYQPDTYQGPVDGYINRSPQVGDTGHDGHVQYVYSPTGWVRV